MLIKSNKKKYASRSYVLILPVTSFKKLKYVRMEIHHLNRDVYHILKVYYNMQSINLSHKLFRKNVT